MFCRVVGLAGGLGVVSVVTSATYSSSTYSSASSREVAPKETAAGTISWCRVRDMEVLGNGVGGGVEGS